MKTCSKCQTPKEESKFYKDSGKKDGLKSWCKSCHNESSRKSESKYKQTRKKWRENNSEEYKKLKQEYYIKNKDKILDGNKKWFQTQKGRLTSYKNNALHRNIDWNLSDKEFFSFWQKPCFYCNEEISTIGIDRIDSLLPYNIDNIVPCCYQCNIIKMDYSLEEFKIRVMKIYNNLKLWEFIEK
jgi:hypothetical protein